MKAIWAAALTVVFLGGPAAAQSTSHSDFGGLDGLFRLNINVNGAEQNVESDSVEGFDVFLEDQELRARFPTYTGAQAVDAVLDFRGVEVFGSYAAGGADFVLEIPDAPTGECENAALGLPSTAPCTFLYAGGTRAENYAEFQDDLEELDNDLLIRLLLRTSAKRSPIDPLAGNPTSVQTALVRNGLDLSMPDSALDVQPNQEVEPWLIGGMYTRVESGRFEGDRYNLRVQRSFALAEGSRGRLKVNLPLSVTLYNGSLAAELASGAGYEFNLVRGKWTLEPRVGYGLVASEDLLSGGQILSGSVTSRYRVDGIGRGYALIGNMIGYTTTLGTGGLADVDVDPEISNTVFRNGVAYELPLNTRLGGRAQSLRGSYTFTNFTGTDLYLEQFHEFALSLGVRTRENEARNSFELFRAGLSATFGDDYHAISASLGARF